jgi:protease I
MDLPLNGKRVLLIVGPDFEDREVFYPQLRMQEAGAQVTIAGIGEKTYTGKYGLPITVDGNTEQYANEAWDAVIIPGGWAPDKIRMNEAALNIVRSADKRGAVVAAICHGGWVLASAEVVSGRKVTSFKAIKDDLIHAGGQWSDAEVVVDKNLVTSRTPADLPAFCREMIGVLSKVGAAV